MARKTSSLQGLLSKVRLGGPSIPKGNAGSQSYRRDEVLGIPGKALLSSKKDTEKRRVILDISVLNKSISCPKFKMTLISQVHRVLPQESWAVSIDLRDTYWHVSIQNSFKKFLGFSIAGRKFQFRVMPFGLNIASLAFTRLTKSIPKELRMNGIQVLVYRDDWLLWAPSKEECKLSMEVTLEVILKRGFLINCKKSCLTRSQTFTWIGIQWETKSASLFLPKETRANILESIRHFFSLSQGET